MIYLVRGWFKITQYDNKREISIANLVETTWLTRYPRPMEIRYDQGSEFIGHDFIKSLIHTEYMIPSKPIILGNPNYNTILEHIQKVLGNIVRKFNIK